MKLPWVKKLSFLQGVLLSLVASLPVAAQIKPDATLPHNSLVTPKLGNVLQIDGGTRAGNNLFHSFTQFNVPTGGTAFFNNALDVTNIFSRVTGGSASSIDGILQARGMANLFLLNPKGIIFGHNARLLIGGYFLGTTASNIKFADGTEFGVNANTTQPVLTVSIPIGLGFGANPGSTSSNAVINKQGTVNIQNLGFSVSNALATVTKFGSTEQAIAGSCIARRNVQRGYFIVTGMDGLPVTPDTDAYYWYAMPLIGVSQSNGAKVQSSIQPVNLTSTRGWKIGDPIVEAQTMIKLPDGRIILGMIPPGVANANHQNLVCNPNYKQ